MFSQAPNSLNRPVSIKKLVFLIIALVLVLGNIVLGIQYFSVKKELSSVRDDLSLQNKDQKVLEFTKLFIRDVLKADKEIDFETRLKLESAVRGLNDGEILAEWQKFTNSQTEQEAQENVKDLLEIIVMKINY